ncbi:MAG: hypothetical protein A2066_21740 [Bacteroidetes bacterium GWB2_41_8]|nr:MAG: hypothetical protein A2066_21740 [Bacteroidetes bacterium GWB2_41_8]
MIIYHNNRPIKKVPKKYLPILPVIAYHIEDFEHLRLSDIERNSLDNELFRRAAENFLMLLSLTDPLVFEQVKDAKPICAGKIKDANNELCTVLKMSNNMTICCDDSLYSISPEKFRPAKQKITQLKCF